MPSTNANVPREKAIQFKTQFQSPRLPAKDQSMRDSASDAKKKEARGLMSLRVDSRKLVMCLQGKYDYRFLDLTKQINQLCNKTGG
jgi:hypothetical protein